MRCWLDSKCLFFFFLNSNMFAEFLQNIFIGQTSLSTCCFPWVLLWGDTPRKPREFSAETDKWKGFLTTRCALCRLIALMALSGKVLAGKCRFPPLLEFSALIISSYFGKLFMGSVALLSLHTRQDRIAPHVHAERFFFYYPLIIKNKEWNPREMPEFQQWNELHWLYWTVGREISSPSRLSEFTWSMGKTLWLLPIMQKKALFSCTVGLASFFKHKLIWKLKIWGLAH